MITDPNIATVVNAEDTCVVVEFYPSDAAPSDDGFDPNDALLCFSEIAGLTFAGVEYQRRIKSMGRTKRSITAEANSFSVELDNEKDSDGVRTMSNFELNNIGFEGLIIVQRLISRALSDTYDKSVILFVGRCDSPKELTRGTLSLSAKQITGGIEADVLRRQYSPTDADGRDRSDPLFEGFPFLPQGGTIELSPRKKRSSWWFVFPVGLLFAKDTPAKTLQWSSYSDVDASAHVPFVFGLAQIAGQLIGAGDIGTRIQCAVAFADAGGSRIEDFTNWRTDDLRFGIEPLDGIHKMYGELGGTGSQLGNTANPQHVGNGLYSRTAVLFFNLNGTQANQTDEAPNIISLVLGTRVPVPDGDGVWGAPAWSDNGAALVRHLLNGADFGKLDDAWVDDEAFFECFKHNNEFIFDTSFSDSIFIPNTTEFEGGSGARAKHLMSTSAVTPDYFKYLAGEKTPTETFLRTAFAETYDTLVPVEPIDPNFPGGGGNELPGLAYYLRRRYTCNLSLHEKMKVNDFIHKVVNLSSMMFMTQGPNGKIKLKNKKPTDFGLAADALTGGEIKIDNVKPWITDKRGFVLVDPNTPYSEVRRVSDALYSTSEGVELSTTTGGFLQLEAFVDGDLTTDPGMGSILVKAFTSGDPFDFTLDGVALSATPGDSDNEATIAGFIYASINAHPRLKRKFYATWDAGNTLVEIFYTVGTLSLDSSLQETHVAAEDDPVLAPNLTAGTGGLLAAGTYHVSYAWKNFRGQTLVSPSDSVTVAANGKIEVDAVTPPADCSVVWFCSPAAGSMKLRQVAENNGAAFEITRPFDKSNPGDDMLPSLNAAIPPDLNRTGAEVMRVEMSFSDRAEPRAGLVRSNILTDSLKFRPGKENTVNRIDFKYRDASQDYRLVELRLSNQASIDKIKKVVPEEYNGQACSSMNEAYRIANAILAEKRDANAWYDLAADREALLLEEGDVICVTDDGAQTYNLPVRIESIEITSKLGKCPVSMEVRKFANTLFDDSVAERQIPVVIQSKIGTEFIEV